MKISRYAIILLVAFAVTVLNEPLIAGEELKGSHTVPEMQSWNLGLRFGMELAAWGSMGWWAYQQTESDMRYAYMILLPVAAITMWGVFNVPGDPSRSGNAPVTVPGWLRLGIELATFAGAAVLLADMNRPYLAGALAGVTVLHYAVSWPRVRWLMDQ